MYAALHIPDFSVMSALRGQPAGRARPCAVLSGSLGQKGREKHPLQSVNPAARLAGIAAGWPLNRALVRCPDLWVIDRDPVAEAEVRAELVRMGESLTPDLEITAADSVLLDLSFRANPVDGELAALDLSGVELWHARAATPDLAYLAARHEATRGAVMEFGDLSALPLGVLASLAGKGTDFSLLDLWGLHTIGDFMKLPRQALIERLGAESGHWHDVLHGKFCRLLRLHRPPESFAQRFDFEDPAVSVEPLVFSLKRLIYTLVGRLAARCLAVRHLDLRLSLESGDLLERCIRFPEPQTSVEGMLPPVRSFLDALCLDAAVVSVEIDAGTTFATAAQREWFGRQLPQPERWAETLAKLEAMLGPGRVGVPVPPNSYMPDAFALRPAVGGGAALSGSDFRPESALPLLRYRPPRQIAVAHETRGRFPWPLALLTGPHPGRITHRRGPFPSSGDWWDPKSWQRMEWDIQVDGRHLLRLVFQMPDLWQVDGIY
jgi:protein ImuB